MANRAQNENVLQSAKKGDILRFKREVLGAELYSHYGILGGDKKIIHRGSVDNNPCTLAQPKSALSPFGIINSKAVIKEDDFWDVVGNGKVEIHNMLDDFLDALPTEDIVARARRSLHEEGYNLFFKNCEHFVTWCRYDCEKSEQVEEAMRKVKSLVDTNKLAEKKGKFYLRILVFLSNPPILSSCQESDTQYNEGSTLEAFVADHPTTRDQPGGTGSAICEEGGCEIPAQPEQTIPTNGISWEDKEGWVSSLQDHLQSSVTNSTAELTGSSCDRSSVSTATFGPEQPPAFCNEPGDAGTSTCNSGGRLCKTPCPREMPSGSADSCPRPALTSSKGKSSSPYSGPTNASATRNSPCNGQGNIGSTTVNPPQYGPQRPSGSFHGSRNANTTSSAAGGGPWGRETGRNATGNSTGNATGGSFGGPHFPMGWPPF